MIDPTPFQARVERYKNQLIQHEFDMMNFLLAGYTVGLADRRYGSIMDDIDYAKAGLARAKKMLALVDIANAGMSPHPLTFITRP